jgi:hypothetical protein
VTVLVASDALVAGEVRVVRLESALGPCVQGLHEKREKVPHPGLQHVYFTLQELERRAVACALCPCGDARIYDMISDNPFPISIRDTCYVKT